tara:strand:- start:1262 stop:1453 length:192 start_codon:yes stop_codon:yes gene_type:complete
MMAMEPTMMLAEMTAALPVVVTVSFVEMCWKGIRSLKPATTVMALTAITAPTPVRRHGVAMGF